MLGYCHPVAIVRTPSLLLLLLLLVCLCVCAQHNHPQGRAHIFVDKALTRGEAQRYCQEHHVDLSSILTQADHQEIQSLKGNEQGAWIGLILGPQNWTWSTGSKPAYYNWRREKGHCAAVTTDGLWVNLDCRTEQPFICQTEEGTYNIISDTKTWSDAKTHCERNGHRLATFKSAAAKPSQWPDTPHWMGLYKRSGGWTWVEGEESPGGLDYTNWHTRLFCGLMASDGGWRDTLCDEKHWFVCADEPVPDLMEAPRSWHRANEACRDKNTHLVAIHDANENDRLRRRFASFGGEFWIGLTNNPWRWPDGSSAELQHWMEMEPNNYKDTDEDCVVVYEGLWYDLPCSYSMPFFCLMKEKLRLVTAPSSWEEALLHCRGQGGELASIKDADNQKLAQRVVQDAITTHVWMGLRFLAGEWLWLSGADLAYHQWAAGERQEKCPLHHCAAVDRNTGYWVHRNCEEKLEFLCKLP